MCGDPRIFNDGTQVPQVFRNTGGSPALTKRKTRVNKRSVGSSAGFPLTFARPVPVFAHNSMCRFQSLRQYIKERAHALCLEDDSPAVLVGLHSVIQAGFCEDGFQAQGIVQPLSNIDKFRVVVFEVRGVALHLR